MYSGKLCCMANGGDAWGIFSNLWVSLRLSPYTASLKILRHSSGTRIRTVLRGEAARWGMRWRGGGSLEIRQRFLCVIQMLLCGDWTVSHWKDKF